MTSNKKVSSLGLALGIALGLASAGTVVNAGSIGDTYTTGDTLTAAKMDTIKGAVNDNDTRITGVIANTQAGALKTAVDTNTSDIGTLTTTVGGHTTSIGTLTTDVTNLKGNAGASTCVTNNTSDVMVRVGPLCVDRYRASLWPDKTSGGSQITTIPGGCLTDGKGCSGIVAQSRASVTPIDGSVITWSQAQAACTNAGKRLLTPGEWMAAYSNGQIPELSTVGKQEYIDLVALTYGAASPGLVQVGYIGVTDDAANPGVPGNPGINAGSNNFTYDIVAGVANIFGFRCAR